jgi:aspartyl-tRNA synthetase
MRTHYCGELRKEHIGETVTFYGWVDRRRDHGGVIFLDLRDRSGIVQIVSDPQRTPDSYEQANAIRNEYVVKITGRVTQRRTPQRCPQTVTFPGFHRRHRNSAGRLAVKISLFGLATGTDGAKYATASPSH